MTFCSVFVLNLCAFDVCFPGGDEQPRSDELVLDGQRSRRGSGQGYPGGALSAQVRSSSFRLSFLPFPSFLSFLPSVLAI